MSRPAAKGWCPGAYRPMMSGDGLVVRVRPLLARLTRDQVLGLCKAAQEFGSGVLDLTSRSNLQIRGVTEANHEALLQRLFDLDLLPDDPILESRRNILIAPFWKDGDETHSLASELTRRLGELPGLPAKVGYAVDTGPTPQFQKNSADFRFERGENTLILRADGSDLGCPVTPESAVDALIGMAHWFADTRGTEHRRMAVHLAQTDLPAEWRTTAPLNAASPLAPGATDNGDIYGAAFGKIDATALAGLINDTGAQALRVTPWRLILLEGTSFFADDTSDFITCADDPLLNIDACPGAPLCTSATVETRALARTLAPLSRRPLHISGCSKGCARPRRCETTLVGRNGRFDLVRNGLPWDEPLIPSLTPETLAQRIGECDAL
ncbi:cobalamin biosynthesis protein CobG [Shimia abyssi]|uniref:Precorrin-3B synthase n=1 Tax=Shimia abyssi TaxID=1662395 RepID=A0A2P8FD85_9RHOB|nr:cobalamin biosynthesis protein CobG [Shimia abyssi]PSL19682.1 precorrin-3B synthase [Shimia abyssi]